MTDAQEKVCPTGVSGSQSPKQLGKSMEGRGHGTSRLALVGGQRCCSSLQAQRATDKMQMECEAVMMGGGLEDTGRL